MITDSYVSFDTALLLEEKGFNDVPVHTYYSRYGGSFDMAPREFTNKALYERGYIASPTLQMAMRWLREEYNIFINIDVIPYTTVTMEQRYYFYKIYRNRRPINFPPQKEDLQFYDTPEEAIEAGIKFSLENLI